MSPDTSSSKRENGTHGSNVHLQNVLGQAAFRLWPALPRDVQELLFETAVGADEDLANRLATFLHDHHPRTAHPPRPTQLA